MSEKISTLDGETEGRVETFVLEWLVENEIPGVGIGIIDETGVVYADGFGARHVTSNKPVTRDTLFGFGSITKSITALAILQLVQEGAIAIKDPIDSYLSYVSFEDDPISIEELLTHTSGVPGDGILNVLISRMMGLEPKKAPISSREDIRRHIQRSFDERVVDGDDHFFYYNTGYTLLGEIIETVSGQPFASYIQENVFEPLGMTRSTFERAVFENSEDTMTPYYREAGELKEGHFPFDARAYAPGGAISSVNDMCAYLQYVMNGQYEGVELLEQRRLTELFLPRATKSVGIDGVEQRYGYGWVVQEYQNDTLVGHAGSMGVSAAYAGFLKERKLGVVTVCNIDTAPPGPTELGEAILAIMTDTEPEAVVPAFGLEAKLSPLVGSYETYRGVLSAQVERDGGNLVLNIRRRLGTQQLVLFPTSTDPDEHEFYAVSSTGERISVRFVVTDSAVDIYYERWCFHKT